MEETEGEGERDIYKNIHILRERERERERERKKKRDVSRDGRERGGREKGEKERDLERWELLCNSGITIK